MTPEAVEHLVANHRRFLAFLRPRLGSLEEAEELLQAAYVKGVEKGGDVQSTQNVVAWFYRLLRNALIDHYRHRDAGRRALEVQALVTASPPEDEGSRRLYDEICSCVTGLLATIKPEYAEILRRVDLEDEPVAGAAAALGLSAGNARVRLHRARRALRARLEQSCGTCTEHACLDCDCQHT